jgi:hypothetical protein
MMMLSFLAIPFAFLILGGCDVMGMRLWRTIRQKEMGKGHGFGGMMGSSTIWNGAEFCRHRMEERYSQKSPPSH